MGEDSFFFFGLITCELTRFSDACERFRLYLHGFTRFSCIPCTFTLLFHLLDEAFLVHTQPVLPGIFPGQFIRETVCVIEAECIFAFDDRIILSRFITQPLVYADAFIERVKETLLLLLDDFPDEVTTIAYVGIESTHDIRHSIGQFVHEGTFDIEVLAEPYSTPDETAEDVTAPFV